MDAAARAVRGVCNYSCEQAGALAGRRSEEMAAAPVERGEEPIGRRLRRVPGGGGDGGGGARARRRDPPWTRMDAKLSPGGSRLSLRTLGHFTRPRSRRVLIGRRRTRPRRTPRTTELAAECDRVGSVELKFPNLGSQVARARRRGWAWTCAEDGEALLAADRRALRAARGRCAARVRRGRPRDAARSLRGGLVASAWAVAERSWTHAWTPPSMARGPRARMRLSRGRGRGREPRCWTRDDRRAGAEDLAAFETAPRWPARRVRGRPIPRPGACRACALPLAARARARGARVWRIVDVAPRSSTAGAHARTRRRGSAPVARPRSGGL